MRRLVSRITAAGYEALEASSGLDAARLDDMLTTRTAPMSNTDVEFLRGHGSLAEQFKGQPRMLQQLLAAAKKQGFTPGPNDVYLSSLAKKPGDPKAFVPPTGGRNHVRRVCEKRGWSCDDGVKVKGREPENPPQPTALANNLIKREARKLLSKDPAAARLSPPELRARVIQERGAKVSK